MATCQFALEDFEHAHSNLEEALSLSGHNTESVLDYRQIAEILNNLGCLSYMGGKPGKAMRLFQESLQAQEIASDDSLYTGTKFSCHSGESELFSLNIVFFYRYSGKSRKIVLTCLTHLSLSTIHFTASLNMSIAQGNVGFIALVTRDIPASTAALESALKVRIPPSLHKCFISCVTERYLPFLQEQQLLLRDAHVTLISTMDHLVITNMLGGRLRKSLQVCLLLSAVSV
jgi:tetratricopeptide (TPR) repeat protein